MCGAVVHCAAPKDAAIPVVRTRIGLMQLLVACAAVLTAGTFLKVVVALFGVFGVGTQQNCGHLGCFDRCVRCVIPL